MDCTHLGVRLSRPGCLPPWFVTELWIVTPIRCREAPWQNVLSRWYAQCIGLQLRWSIIFRIWNLTGRILSSRFHNSWILFLDDESLPHLPLVQARSHDKAKRLHSEHLAECVSAGKLWLSTCDQKQSQQLCLCISLNIISRFFWVCRLFGLGRWSFCTGAETWHHWVLQRFLGTVRGRPDACAASTGEVACSAVRAILTFDKVVWYFRSSAPTSVTRSFGSSRSGMSLPYTNEIPASTDVSGRSRARSPALATAHHQSRIATTNSSFLTRGLMCRRQHTY
jgi:hypothetical protein